VEITSLNNDLTSFEVLNHKKYPKLKEELELFIQENPARKKNFRNTTTQNNNNQINNNDTKNDSNCDKNNNNNNSNNKNTVKGNIPLRKQPSRLTKVNVTNPLERESSRNKRLQPKKEKRIAPVATVVL
jgi:hypothetical protein